MPGSQTLALSCPADIILFHGTRGPGKTDAQLMRFRRNVGRGYGKFWRGVIFDRRYKNLDDLVSKSQRWFPEFNDGARFLSSKSDFRWVWRTGEELLFRTAEKESDYWDYHGQEFPFIGWNELTKYPDLTLFEAMMSCNRSSFRPQDFPLYRDKRVFAQTGQTVILDARHPRAEKYLLPPMPLEVFATTNPFGPGHNAVKKRFINVGAPGEIVKSTTEVFNPQTQKKEPVTVTQTHIFGSYKENRMLDPKYVAQLQAIKDINKRKAWLAGSWDITSGGMFDDLWSDIYHVRRPFRIPHSWYIDRSFDWGSAKPFSVGWWAESDGSDYVDVDGVVHSTVRGDIFRIGEWYGTTGKANEGLNLVPKRVTEGIIQREISMGIYSLVHPGPADNSINDMMSGVASVASQMAQPVRIDGKMYPGIVWGLSDKKAGSRKAGWQKLREYLDNALPNDYGGRESPGLFVFDNCAHFRELFPILPRDEKDPDDVDTNVEDHVGDEVRYEILSKSMGAMSGTTRGV